MNTQPKLGSFQVNSTDYENRIVIECFDYCNMADPCWHVPAWEERGWPFADLVGPFGSVAEAQAAMKGKILVKVPR